MAQSSASGPSRGMRKLLHYFLQGLIILAPIAITIYAVAALFNLVDNIIPDLLGHVFPGLVGQDESGNPRRIPGLGFVLVVLTVLLVGYVSSSFIVGRLVDLFGRILERTPGIKIIYGTLRDFFEAFAGNNRKFDKAVLVSVFDREVWQVGFITQGDMERFGMQEYYSVYLPKSYALTGELFFVKADRIKPLPAMSATDAMKFVISGGVAEVEPLNT